MKHALIVGGTSGIGLAIAIELAKECEKVTIIGRCLHYDRLPSNVSFLRDDLSISQLNWTKLLQDIDFFFFSAGIGRVSYFENLALEEIERNFQINVISFFKIISLLNDKLKSNKTFYCGVISSIASRIVSPLFSIYSATKAALFRGVESINAELFEIGTENRICEIAPGAVSGTSFTGKSTEIDLLKDFAVQCITAVKNRDTAFIPSFNSVYKDVIKRYNDNAKNFAHESYIYKVENDRIQSESKLIVGYLSGSFDLFHIGHLNLLKNARAQCDILVVGVHKDGSHKNKELFIPYEDRKEIVKNIKYVDKVIESEKEDSDVYDKGILKYNRLFVGSDYKGSVRFNRYEEYFKDKNVEIVYFPYTEGISSTKLRYRLKGE